VADELAKRGIVVVVGPNIVEYDDPDIRNTWLKAYNFAEGHSWFYNDLSTPNSQFTLKKGWFNAEDF